MENSKILYSYYKRRIPNSFSGTPFNRHCLLFKTGQLQTVFQFVLFFTFDYWQVRVNKSAYEFWKSYTDRHTWKDIWGKR